MHAGFIVKWVGTWENCEHGTNRSGVNKTREERDGRVEEGGRREVRTFWCEIFKLTIEQQI